MKHIERPEEIPAILTDKGKEKTDSNISVFKNNILNKKGKLDFDFDHNVYGHISVKQALLKAQKETCCYCESSIGESFPGDVEHYRPKGKCQQGEGKPTHEPAYYWLAYEWSNLLVSCEICNKSFKKIYFPLTNPEVRQEVFQKRDVTKEQPTLINPYEVTDIEKHIEFKDAFEYGITKEGGDTIKYCGLDRDKLYKARLRLLNPLLTIKKKMAENIKKGKLEAAKDNEEMLKEFVKEKLDEGVYTLMIRCNFKEYID